MSEQARTATHAQLRTALEAAHAAGRGIPSSLEFHVRAYACAAREAGADVADLLIEVKTLVRAIVGADEVLFVPKVVGWSVAGYFACTGHAAD